jgi:hypothetical protein
MAQFVIMTLTRAAFGLEPILWWTRLLTAVKLPLVSFQLW